MHPYNLSIKENGWQIIYFFKCSCVDWLEFSNNLSKITFLFLIFPSLSSRVKGSCCRLLMSLIGEEIAYLMHTYIIDFLSMRIRNLFVITTQYPCLRAATTSTYFLLPIAPYRPWALSSFPPLLLCTEMARLHSIP